MDNNDFHYVNEEIYSMSLSYELLQAAAAGNIKGILSSLDSEKHDKIAYLHFKEDWCLSVACINGNNEVVKFLLESADLKEHCYINGFDNKDSEPPLAQAAFGNQFETVKFLLTSPELKQNADIHVKNDMVFRGACRHSNLEMIDYLLNSSELDEHIDVSNNQDIFAIICRLDPPKTIEYLLNKAIVPKPNYHSYNDSFLNACSRQNNDTIDYLVDHPDYSILLDMNYKNQEALKFLIKKDNLNVIGKLFRDYDIDIEPTTYTILQEDKYKHIIDVIDKNTLYRNLNKVDYIDKINNKTRLKI